MIRTDLPGRYPIYPVSTPTHPHITHLLGLSHQQQKFDSLKVINSEIVLRAYLPTFGHLSAELIKVTTGLEWLAVRALIFDKNTNIGSIW